MCRSGTERKWPRLVVEETAEEMGGGLLGVWDTADGGIFIPVAGTNVVTLQQQLTNSGTEPL